MSWHRQIKTIYTLAFVMFIFICFSLVVELTDGERINISIYLIMFAGAAFMQYLTSKNTSRLLSIGAPILLIAMISYHIYSLKIAIINTIVNIILIIFLEKIELEDINHDVYKNRMKIALFILSIIGISAPSLNKVDAHWVFRYYILFLILAILTLRETRNFCNKIKNKKSAATNLSIILFGAAATTDYTFSIVSKMFSYGLAAIKSLLSKISEVVFAVFYKPIMNVLDYIIAKWSSKHVDPLGLSGPGHTTIIDKPSANHYGAQIISIIVFIIAVIIIVRLIINFYMRLNRTSMNKGKTIEKERIYNSESKKIKRELSNIITKFFGKGKSIKEQILYVYSKFQLKMKMMNIFKPWMTATQLSNVAKVKIDNFQALDSIKDIYNEAKFSSHKIDKEQLQEIKEKYERIKKC